MMKMDEPTVTLRVKAKEFQYDGVYITFTVRESDVLYAMPMGTYKGFNWWKPLVIDSIRNLVMGVLNHAN